MEKNLLRIIVVLFVSFFLVSCSRQSGTFTGTFTSKNGKFSFEVPEGWKIKDNTKERLTETVSLGSLAQNSISETPEANIIVLYNDGTDSPYANTILEFLIGQHIEEFYKAQGYDIVEILNKSVINFKGANGVRLEMLIKTSAPDFEWIEIKATDYLIFKGYDYYIIGFSCFSDLFYYYDDIFMDIYESFEFIE